ncbi:MAG: hypothetical protein SF097_12490 [Acidobacteriota bacterium]|nr:hypothetical protein [Acidobacteriota bacterium]
MNLSEKLAAAEKAAKANAEAQAEAERQNKALQKVRHDELVSRVKPAAGALKIFIESVAGRAIIKFLKQTNGQMFLDSCTPKIGFWRDLINSIYAPTESYRLSGDGLLVDLDYVDGPVDSEYSTQKKKTRRASWEDYVSLCRCRALRGEDPFYVIEQIKSQASMMADKLLNA